MKRVVTIIIVSYVCIVIVACMYSYCSTLYAACICKPRILLCHSFTQATKIEYLWRSVRCIENQLLATAVELSRKSVQVLTFTVASIRASTHLVVTVTMQNLHCDWLK